MEDKRKFKLSFVNKGKEFVIPTPTVSSQEAYLDDLTVLEKKNLEDDVFTREANKLMVLATLRLVDKKVNLTNIRKMHPLDYVDVFNEITRVFQSDRELSDDEEDFQQKT